MGYQIAPLNFRSATKNARGAGWLAQVCVLVRKLDACCRISKEILHHAVVILDDILFFFECDQFFVGFLVMYFLDPVSVSDVFI